MMDYDQLREYVLRWCLDRYKSRPAFTYGNLHTAMCDATNFRRLNPSDEEKRQLSVISRLFVTIPQNLVKEGFIVIAGESEIIPAHLGRSYEVLPKILDFAPPNPPPNPPPKCSPWLDRDAMIELLKLNKDESDSRQTIMRRKQKWGAEPRLGTDDKEWRFALKNLRDNNVKYPAEWD